MKVAPWKLKESDELRAIALADSLTAKKKDRKDFLQQYSGCVYRLLGLSKPALLFQLNALSPDPSFKILRLYLNKNFSPGEDTISPEALAAAYFLYDPHCLSVELLMPAASLNDEQNGEKLFLADESLNPMRATRFYFSRFQIYPEYSLVMAQSFALLLRVDLETEEIASLRFLREGQYLENMRERFFLDFINLCDREGRFRPGSSEVKAGGEYQLSPLQKKAEAELIEYLSGSRKNFDLPLKLNQGTSFQNQVWRCLREIPYACTISYEELARAVVGAEDAPRYARAVGMACGANPLPIFQPCHRVIGSRGELTGFSGGVEVKEALLNLELFNYHIV